MLFEHSTEIAAIIIADFCGDLVDIELILQQQELCLLNTLSGKILKWSEVKTLFEQSAKILRRKIDKVGKLHKGQFFSEILVNIINNRLELIKFLTVLTAVLQINYPMQLNEKLIKIRRTLMTTVVIIGLHKIKYLLENSVNSVDIIYMEHLCFPKLDMFKYLDSLSALKCYPMSFPYIANRIILMGH